MNTIPLEFDITSSDSQAALGVRVSLNGSVLYDNSHVLGTHHFVHHIPDEDFEHELSIELYGKQPEHTTVDQSGAIVKDALITVSNIQVDSINIDQLSQKLIQYHHDFNGSQEPVVDQFYGSMGCNGWVRMKFTTPIYLWLLENM